jgi:hypothetical protein
MFWGEIWVSRYENGNELLVITPATAEKGKQGGYDRYFPTIGILRPMPKALGDTRSIGGVW